MRGTNGVAGVPPMMGPMEVFFLVAGAAAGAVEATSAPLAEINRNMVKSASPL